MYAEEIAASGTNKPLGSDGAAGDLLDSVTIIPTSTTCGAVTITDGVITLHPYIGGTVGADLRSWTVFLGVRSRGPWLVTTGAGVKALCVGDFS